MSVPQREAERGRTRRREGARGRSIRSLLSVHRSMLAPQSLRCGRDYRTQNATGHLAACRSSTWELQVEVGVGVGVEGGREGRKGFEGGGGGRLPVSRSREHDGNIGGVKPAYLPVH